VRKESAPHVTPDTLIEYLRGKLARYKVPKQVVFLDALPISGAGKIMKNDLRRMALNMEAGESQ
jgi:fatty-acyl-CoA synthase